MMDSLTVHYLARELDARWRGRRVRSWVLDREGRSVTLETDGSHPVRVDLSTPVVRVSEAQVPARESLLDGWTVIQVTAPIDDRRLVIRLEKPGKFRGSPARTAVLELSLVPTARGIVLRDGHGHRMASMGAKLPSPSEPRPLLAPDELRRAAERREPEALLHGRWMSPLLARWLVDGGARAVDAYASLCALPAAEPARCNGQLVPFPWCDDAVRVPSLIESAPSGAVPAPTGQLTRRARSVARMREELSRAADAPVLRRTADALLAMGEVPAPAHVQLQDGTCSPVSARAGETAVAAAERMYRDVRSMERALELLPRRIAEMERQAGAEDGTGDGVTRSARRQLRVRGERQERPAQPFRRYRSSGGLDIWVGRGAVSNDALTFHEAAPNDVWLHARDAAGAHVVLRWTRDEPPPSRDLEEAAALAAWHSKMRSSTIVPVDWTRRKHVHKVRGGAPGLVTVQRARTIFARPRADLERALRTDR